MEAQADVISGAVFFFTQLEQPMAAVMAGLRIARDGGAVTIRNPAPAAELPEGMLPLCGYVMPNETEAETLSGVAVADLASARAAGDAPLALGVRRAVILTLEAQCALYHDTERSEEIPALNAGDVVETTAAGDAFNGSFATALAEGRDPVAAAHFACAAAALSVTRAGASMATREEIDALLATQAGTAERLIAGGRGQSKVVDSLRRPT